MNPTAYQRWAVLSTEKTFMAMKREAKKAMLPRLQEVSLNAADVFQRTIEAALHERETNGNISYDSNYLWTISLRFLTNRKQEQLIERLSAAEKNCYI
jgi:hypothetical protein